MSMRGDALLKIVAALALAILPLSNAAAQTQPAAQAAEPARKTVARISMTSANPETLKRFYTEVFGFVPAWEGVIGEGPNIEVIAKAWHLNPGSRLNGVLLRAPRGDMELQITYVTGQTIKQLPRIRTAAPFSGDHYFVINVPDLDAAVARMKPFKTEFNRGPMKMTAIDNKGRSYPVYEAVVYDPEGTILILVQDVQLPS